VPSCAISGTPSSGSSGTYTITASNPAGSVNASVSLSIANPSYYCPNYGYAFPRNSNVSSTSECSSSCPHYGAWGECNYWCPNYGYTAQIYVSDPYSQCYNNSYYCPDYGYNSPTYTVSSLSECYNVANRDCGSFYYSDRGTFTFYADGPTTVQTCGNFYGDTWLNIYGSWSGSNDDGCGNLGSTIYIPYGGNFTIDATCFNERFGCGGTITVTCH
jgi:hypothetical protein